MTMRSQRHSVGDGLEQELFRYFGSSDGAFDGSVEEILQEQNSITANERRPLYTVLVGPIPTGHAMSPKADRNRHYSTEFP